MTARTPETILRELADVVRQTFPDRDYSGPVESPTRVFADLGLASIDVVVLAEKLEQFYGRRLPFGPFLAGLRTRGAEDLELGELVTFLQQHTSG
jgi:acyl carrier protein